MSLTRVRYGKVSDEHGNLKKKNVLVTVRRENDIYWAIARCNIKEDEFNRDKAKATAFERLAEAMAEYLPFEKDICVAISRPDGLAGRIHVSLITELLEYFNKIDKSYGKTLSHYLSEDRILAAIQ